MTNRNKSTKTKRWLLQRKHRATMFRGIFIIPKNFLQLLSKCSGSETNLTESDLIPFDLESMVFVRRRRNDVSFITADGRLIILIEHQSTVNMNMALKMLLYYMELLQIWIKQNNIDIHKNSQLPPIPEPEFYVVYNGKSKLKEFISEFKMECTSLKIKATVNIVDIRYENLEEQGTDNALAGYAFFYKVFDEGMAKGLGMDEAFSQARVECMRAGYLEGYIEREGFMSFYKDFLDYDKQVEANAWNRAHEEGDTKGFLRAAKKFLDKGMTIQEVSETLELTEAQITQLKQQAA